MMDGDWVRAEQELAIAVSIPSEFTATWDYAEFLEAAGYLQDALEYRREARELMPLNVAPAVDLATVYYRLGDEARAVQELERAEGLVGDPTGVTILLMSMAMSRGDTAAVRDALSDLSRFVPGDPYLTVLDETLDAPETARDRLLELRAVAPLPGRLAYWAAYLGEPDLAAELVRSGAIDGPIRAQNFWEPIMRDARRTEAFKQTMRDIGLVDFWRTRGWPAACRATRGDDFECD